MLFLKNATSFKAKLNCFNTKRLISNEKPQQICIVGAGPAGFYAAQRLVKKLKNCFIDIIERYPVPFGLVRYGVAPDHPEVKNVINTFAKTAEHPRVRFLGNLSLGKDFTLQELRDQYHIVLLSYGAEEDRKLNIPNEDMSNVISAREFVAWYNGVPGSENYEFDLNTPNVTIIGQGNVAIDVARILLSSTDKLKTTDITDYALAALSASKVKEVFLVGRRGPLQAAYTIKELREMLNLPDVKTIWNQDDFKGVKDVLPNLQRPRKRITELMLKSLEESKTTTNIQQPKKFCPIFLRSPKSIQDKKLEAIVNFLDGNTAIPTEKVDILPGNFILRSIGYTSVCADKDLNFDSKNGIVFNNSGRVLSKKSTENEVLYENGVYVAGWVATGPTGVILTTMNNAFGVADTIIDDCNRKVIDSNNSKPGINIIDKRIVTWNDWLKINNVEIENGKNLGKPREKIVDIIEMLTVADV